MPLGLPQNWQRLTCLSLDRMFVTAIYTGWCCGHLTIDANMLPLLSSDFRTTLYDDGKQNCLGVSSLDRMLLERIIQGGAKVT